MSSCLHVHSFLCCTAETCQRQKCHCSSTLQHRPAHVGGYKQDKWAQGCADSTAFSFWHWQCVDLFIYFSHAMVAIPTVGWCAFFFSMPPHRCTPTPCLSRNAFHARSSVVVDSAATIVQLYPMPGASAVSSSAHLDDLCQRARSC